MRRRAEAVRDDRRDPADAVDVALDHVAAEAVLGAHRQLEVDRAAGTASASELSLSVSFMTSALNQSPSTAVAVRQTPFTEIESPSASSAASSLATRRRTPSAELLDADDLPEVGYQAGEQLTTP